MKQQLFVVKVGGNVIEDDAKIASFLTAFKQLKGLKILVHGGGKLASSMAARLGIEVKMVDGRRITDHEMIDVVTMVYGGLVNKQLVARLQALGCNALGLTGADGDLITSHQRPIKNGIDFGFVGDPFKVNHNLLSNLLDDGVVPVIAPITHDGKGALLNTNADTMANEIAQAMKKTFDVTLVYAFELKGVLENIGNEETLIKFVDRSIFERLTASGIIHSGMLPKLTNALEAVDGGIASVNICHYGAIGRLADADFHDFTKIGV